MAEPLALSEHETTRSMETLGLGNKACPMCSFAAPSIATLLRHLRSVHSMDPHFHVTCGIDGCINTSKTFPALYSHIYRHHPNVGIISQRSRSRDFVQEASTSTSVALADPDRCDVNSEQLTGVVGADLHHLTGKDIENQRRCGALFILKMKEHRRTSQVAIDDIVEGCRGLFAQAVSRVHAGVRTKLATVGIDPDEIEGLNDVFENLADPFDGLETCYKQEKYFLDNLGLIEPREVKVGEPQYRPQFCGSKRRLTERWDTYQYVPLLPSLKKLLSDGDVVAQIEECPKRIRNDGVIEDFCDGQLFKQHALFSQDPFALQIIAYYDELELCNPLGTHVKQHKLGIVFFTLGNIHPKFRSSLRAINLALCAAVPVIEKYGIDQILQPFLQDLTILATQGISITHDGAQQTYKGALLAFLADNLASNELGGFKLSFSFAFRFCRTCLVTTPSLASGYTDDAFEVRTTESHERHCSLLNGPLRDHYSKTYGVNRRSSLLGITNFNMFGGGLPHDAMHDVLEGVAPLEIKLLLVHCITAGFFTLNYYNTRLVNFNYGYTESDKPTPITNKSLQSSSKSIRSSASQMLLLLRLLPFLVGDEIPEGDHYWECFLLLRQIVDIVVSPTVSENLCVTLKCLVEKHHTLFVSLYGVENYIPKLHFLVHYPAQILAVGPMVRTWTIRHEAKLNFFKQASHLANFKKVAFSLANRHQRWMCYEMASGNFLHTPLECGPGSLPSLLKDEPTDIQEAISTIFPQISPDVYLSRPTWVRAAGVLYKNNNAYVITGSDGLDPVFSHVNGIIVLGGDYVIFDVHLCKVLYFDDHYHGYVIRVTPQRSLVHKLLDHNVFHGHKIGSDLTCIALKYYFLQ